MHEPSHQWEINNKTMDKVEEMCENVPCRRQQIELISSLFGNGEPSSMVSVPGIFLCGHTATGKSLVFKQVVQSLKIPHVTVNCVESYTMKLMFEQILNSVSKETMCAENEYTCYAKCDNMNDFVRLLRQAVAEQNMDEEPLCLMFERAERLRDVEINLLPSLLRLQELSGLNVTVVLESEIVWEKFRTGTGFLEPVIVHFPDYSKDEIIEVIATDVPTGYDESFYRMYLNLLLSVFYLACRNFNELRHLAQLNFVKYTEPIKNGEATEKETGKLWKNIEPHLKKALQTVYLREVSSAQWERLQEESLEQGTTIQVQGVSSRVNMELPFFSKYLLIAAYLASYNPAKTDRRFFAKNAGKINRRTQLAQHKRNERTSNQLLGPKAFPLDRMMAIFYAIVEGRVAPTANVYTQITSLVTIGLLGQVASTDILESPKYKCLVSLDFIKPISRSVNFEVVKHLYDFV